MLPQSAPNTLLNLMYSQVFSNLTATPQSQLHCLLNCCSVSSLTFMAYNHFIAAPRFPYPVKLRTILGGLD